MYKPLSDCQIPRLDEIYLKNFGYKTDGTFVEIGAYDGHSISNTSFLADIGWKGIYVEPVKEYYEKCNFSEIDWYPSFTKYLINQGRL